MQILLDIYSNNVIINIFQGPIYSKLLPMKLGMQLDLVTTLKIQIPSWTQRIMGRTLNLNYPSLMLKQLQKYTIRKTVSAIIKIIVVRNRASIIIKIYVYLYNYDVVVKVCNCIE